MYLLGKIAKHKELKQAVPEGLRSKNPPNRMDSNYDTPCNEQHGRVVSTLRIREFRVSYLDPRTGYPDSGSPWSSPVSPDKSRDITLN